MVKRFKSAREQNEEYRNNELKPIICYVCGDELGGKFYKIKWGKAFCDSPKKKCCWDEV